MTREWDVLEVLKHYRHDWLNKLQLIKGNLDIGRTEKAATIIDEIIQQSRNESHLSNMNIPDLATRLITFNWEEHPYLLTVETITGDKDWSQHESEIKTFLDEMFLLFDKYANYGDDNHIILIFKDLKEFKIELDFQGELPLNSTLEREIQQLQNKFGNILGKIEWDKHGCFINLNLTN